MMTQLYQISDATRQFHLAVGDGHQLEVEEYGCAAGVPVIICHGGPGTGICHYPLHYFNPERYRIILYSQRGCGGSTPHSTAHNTTAHLLQDLTTLLDHLDITKTVLAGGSWGATLALLYALAEPKRVRGLVLWSSFLSSSADFAWMYSPEGAGAQFYPEQYQQFNSQNLSWQALLAQYHQRLNGKDELLGFQAAQHWCQWERLLIAGESNPRYLLAERQHQLLQARLMVHFFTAGGFVPDGFILQHATQLQSIPSWFIHGRHDLICRFAGVQALATTMHAKLLILDGIGHCVRNSVYSEAIRRAADLLLIKLDH
ncbi:alpha/beta fold hydrolase [Pseudoalteromonas fenneropenaei]|uniref:Proline iminopeptidase n=1 Tax=Pseudoalteromonas fenneropenaei TaxID=1737459 RepID=A0ABV7CJX1_9GAMM